MSDAVAADAATTDWRTYDGGVPPRFMFYAVFFPVVMAVILAAPVAICYCCLSKGRVVPYSPPNVAGIGMGNSDLVTFLFLFFFILFCLSSCCLE